MAVTFYYASGSPYAWRVWLALEHKGIPHDFKLLSFDAGDLRKPEFLALNPRHRVPVLVDDGFALSESAAILEYVDERWPSEPRLFDADMRRRAVQRRMVREADEYVADLLETLAEAILFTPAERRSADEISILAGKLGKELALWEAALSGDYLTGALSAADLTLYPMLALILRMDSRHPPLGAARLLGPRLAAWSARMQTLPIVSRTWPPHWK
jgi:glutathione S-transferase